MSLGDGTPAAERRAARWLIAGGRIVDPLSGHDAVGDVAIEGKRIVAIGRAPDGFAAEWRLDAAGLVVMPGLIDLAARLGEPGNEHAGMLESEMSAAVAGGVTSIVCPPDTDPVLDEPGLVEMLKFRARSLNRSRLFPLGALTRGLGGDALTEMAELTEAGCVGFSQADTPIVDTLVLHRALQYAATFGYITWLRPQDAHLGHGVAAKGALATRLGLTGVPVIAETIALATIFELVRDTRARVHLCRLSSAAGVAMVRAAKAEGLPVTCDISIHQLHLTDADIGYFDSSMRLTPPLRQQRDREALRLGLFDATIDALVSDHTPVDQNAKDLPFAEAEPGATGLELLLAMALKWGDAEAGTDVSTRQPRAGTTAAANTAMHRALAAVTCGPAVVLAPALREFGRSAGRLVAGGAADLCVYDPRAEWTLDPAQLCSQGRQTPFVGHHLRGRVVATVVAGRLVHDLLAVSRTTDPLKG